MSVRTDIRASGKNISLQIMGIVTEDFGPQVIFDIGKADPPMSGIRLDGILFAIQEKLGLLLWWDEEMTELILPLESRGAFRFDGGLLHKLGSHPWSGRIYLSSFGFGSNPASPKHFTLLIDGDRL